MKNSDIKSNGGIIIGGSPIWTVSVPNSGIIYNDLIYLIKSLNKPENNEEDNKRYARLSIIIMAFYIESLSNLLFDEIGEKFSCSKELNKIIEKQIKKDDNGNILPKPIRKLISVYFILYNNKLPIDISGIQDLFLIRNKIIAHPPARSIISKTGFPREKGLTENGNNIKYNKFINFPNILGNFTKEHAVQLYNEVKIFLREYFDIFPELPNLLLCGYFQLSHIDESG